MNNGFNDFDLQRFNDGVVQPSEDTTTNQQPSEPDQSNEPQEDSGNDFEFVLDEQGNLNIVEKSATDEPSEQENQQQPEFYTPEQISELGLDKLDPNKLPPEILPFYKQMQADYTRKTQDLANKNKDLDTRIAELNQPQQQPQDQTPVEQPDPAKAQRQYYEEVYKIAKGNIEKYLGEQFDELNPLHVAALSDEVASIKAYVVQTQMHQQQVANIMNQYVNDPEWKEIEKYTENALNNLPYQQSMIIRQRLQSGDINFLNEFLSVSKAEYLKAKNGVPPIPQTNTIQQPKPPAQVPKIEGAGSGVATNQPQNFDYKKLGKMTNDQLAETFIGLGLTKM